MKISKQNLKKIVREEMARLKRAKRKTIRIRESKLRKIIREELSEMQMIDVYDMPREEMPREEMPGEQMGGGDGGCGGAPVDKHGSLANPPQKPMKQPAESGPEYHHPAPGMEWEMEDGDLEEDLLYDMGGY